MAEAATMRGLAERVEGLDRLDGLGQRLGKALRGAVGPGELKAALSGTWLGHPLHPVLTDVTIGAFSGAALLDLLGDEADGHAARRLIAVGLAAYGPTALTGAHDWADTEATDPRVRRLGLVHAATNAVAATLFAGSLAARRRGRPGRGRALSLAGVSVLTAGGYLGGHLSFDRGVGPNQTVYDEGPDDWTPVAETRELDGDGPVSALAGDTPVLLVRHDGGVHALHDRCSHRGCSLAEGELEGGVVTCACHGSRFDVRDGSVLRGPATSPQPAYRTRERDGRIEVRR